jgi:transposase InsO family protein
VGEGGDEVSVAGFIACQRTGYGMPHAVACRALGVSQSWFYKWIGRPPTPRQQRRLDLADRVGKIFAESGGTYGSPRVALELRVEGWRVSTNTVAQLMAQLGLVARPRRRRRSLTKPGRRPAARDHVRRQFVAVAPNLLWCGDLTEIVTDEGKMYMASVLDLFSRKCLGHAFGAHHDAQLAEAALVMAIANRRGRVDGVIFHSDRGSEYTAEAFEAACTRQGIIQSMARVGSALDNAVAEAFNSTIKVEFIHRHRFTTRDQARTQISTWITGFYNPRRRHSACDGMSPDDYERFIVEARGSTRTS